MRHRFVISGRALIRRPPLFLIVVLTAGALAVSCEVFYPGPIATPSRSAALRPRPTLTPTLAIGPESGFTERVNLDEFAPRGRGRDLVIMNCDNCHSWVCAIQGQRTFDHWMLVEDVHQGRGWVILSGDDWDTLFRYLENNFNDQKPEPKLPLAFQGAGCTHSSYR